ncbi:MAG: transposase [Mediterranea sp.]|jgi:hypothetical protein|nr:transposase [Mediterranea sp.]
MRIIDIQLNSDCRQYPIGSIEECISGVIILRSDPLSFHSVVRDLSRLKQRIKMTLHFDGVKIPSSFANDSRISKRFVQWLREGAAMTKGINQEAFLFLKDEFEAQKQSLLTITRMVTRLSKEERYGYCRKIYTGRKPAEALRCDIHFMWLSGKQYPNFNTLNSFRSGRLKTGIGEIFRSLLLFMFAEGFIHLEEYCCDGTILQADANKHEEWIREVAGGDEPENSGRDPKGEESPQTSKPPGRILLRRDHPAGSGSLVWRPHRL